MQIETKIKDLIKNTKKNIMYYNIKTFKDIGKSKILLVDFSNKIKKKLSYINTKIENIRVIKGTNYDYFSEESKKIFFKSI